MYRYPNDPSNTAHLMIVMDPLVFMSKGQLQERMSEFVETIKTSPTWDPDAEMLLPGEIEYRAEQERLRNGIPMPEALYEELKEIGNRFDLDATLDRVAA